MCAKLDLVHEFLSGKNKYLNKPAIVMRACAEGPSEKQLNMGTSTVRKAASKKPAALKETKLVKTTKISTCTGQCRNILDFPHLKEPRKK